MSTFSPYVELIKQAFFKSAISKASIFNQAVTADTDVFGSDLEPTSPPCIFRIYALSLIHI